jgi:putative acyl-CoA dehydrogenase
VAIQRLKDKLGNHSNASSEIELDAALAWRVGPEGRGIRTILGMVSATRLDCVVGSAATQRAALTRAVWHTRHRDAFGARLADQPLMRAVLADLAVESAAATALAMRLATAVDHGEHALLRVLLPAAKYTVCKRTPAAVAESLECLGGTGFVEASGMPRLFRESPLNSIWEGSGSVTALDLLRALDREPEATDALLAELGSAFGADRRLDAAVRDVVAELGDRADGAGGARRLAEKVATAVQGALLVRAGDPDVADLFCATRLGGDWGATLGTLPAGTSAQVTGRIVADGVHLPG